MTRILILFLAAVFLAFVVTWLSSMNTLIVGEAFGARFETPAGFAIGALLFLGGVLIIATSGLKDLVGLPKKLRRKREDAKRDRGMAALTRGLEAVAVGDAVDAQHHARVAQRNLPAAPLTRLLTAQAAHISGDDPLAEQSFAAMLEAPETEFLGLRGLYAKAMRNGDEEAARGFAERAFKLRPNADWAFQSVFDLALDRGAWGQARDALAQAVKNRIVDPPKAARGEAALLTADAYAAAESGDAATAREEIEQALKLTPDLAPAVVLASRLYRDAGSPAKAAKALEDAFAKAPSMALVNAYAALYENETHDKRAERMGRFAALNKDAREAKTAVVKETLLRGKPEDAIDQLQSLILERATSSDYALMAEAVAAAHGEDAARTWLERAATAPRDPSPGAQSGFNFTREGWARLIREYMEHARLAPPPFEDAPQGLPAAELNLLLAPPPAEEAVTEPPVENGSSTSEADLESEPAPATPAQEPSDPDADDNDNEAAEAGVAAARNVS